MDLLSGFVLLAGEQLLTSNAQPEEHSRGIRLDSVLP